MDGTWQNYRNHAALAAAITLICAFFDGPFWGAIIASMYFWGKEIGEKCVQADGVGRPWSDMNPFHPRWSKDARLDLASALAGAWVMALLWSLA